MQQEAMVNFLLGHNDYVDPLVLPEGAYALGRNVTSRSGLIRTRPRNRELLQLPTGRWQGVFLTDRFAVFVIGGNVYRYVYGDSAATQLTSVSRSAYATQCWGCDVNGSVFINDGVHKPIVVGLNNARILGEGEIPCGTVCIFGQGRIFYVDQFQRVLQAGDIDLPYDPSNVFKNSEQAVLNEGLYIKQPGSAGLIRSLAFVQNYQTGTGLGQLVSFSDHSVCAYNVYLPRAQWLANDSQLGQVLFSLEGSGGNPATIQVNNDLFFRAGAAVRTLRTTTAEISEGVRSVPMTISAYNLLKRDSSWSLPYVSGALLDNYLHYTFGARVDALDGSIYFDSILSLDFASFASGQEAQLTCDGLWNGQRYLAVFSANRRVYSVVRGDAGTNYLCTFDEASMTDIDGASVTFRVETPRFAFKDAWDLQEFLAAEVFLSEIKTELDVTLYYRGDDVLWSPCRTHHVNYTGYSDDGVDVYPQSRRKIKLAPYPKTAGSDVTLELANRGTTFQFCLEITGVCQVERVSFMCSDPIKGADIECEDFTAAQHKATTGQFALYDYEAIDG